MVASHGSVRWRFWFERFKLGRMGVVAAGTEIISSLACAGKVSGSLAVDPYFPALVKVAMAFSAEPVAFLEIDQFAVVQAQFVAVFGVMAIEAPSHRFGVMELDVCMLVFQLSLCSIGLHGGVAAAAGEQPLRHGRGSYFLNHAVCRGNKKTYQQEHERQPVAFWPHP
jgi:hypothetical protein